MQSDGRIAPWSNWLLACLVAAGLLWVVADSARAQGLDFVRPGMTQTDLQSVLGPPDYIQVRELRQAWQYCPHRLMRFADRLFRHDHAPYVTVWFDNFRVVGMRSYPSRYMGQCEDFLAAFRWEDRPGGFSEGYAEYGDAYGYGMK